MQIVKSHSIKSTQKNEFLEWALKILPVSDHTNRLQNTRKPYWGYWKIEEKQTCSSTLFLREKPNTKQRQHGSEKYTEIAKWKYIPIFIQENIKWSAMADEKMLGITDH